MCCDAFDSLLSDWRQLLIIVFPLFVLTASLLGSNDTVTTPGLDLTFSKHFLNCYSSFSYVIFKNKPNVKGACCGHDCHVFRYQRASGMFVQSAVPSARRAISPFPSPRVQSSRVSGV